MGRVFFLRAGLGAAILTALFALLLTFPTILEWSVEAAREREYSAMQKEFPVTVSSREKTITEDPAVEEYLESSHSPLLAAAGGASEVFKDLLTRLAVTIANAPWYQALAATDARVVLIAPGMRKEQVANEFGKLLGWSAAEKKEFLTRSPYAALPLFEGSFAPGTYVVTSATTPRSAQALVNERFSREVLGRYSKAVAAAVPLSEALTIASLIEREAGGGHDMRLISGIIWNRLFIGMKLQIDATLQYAKANALPDGSWWPTPLPSDRFRASPYNTYRNAGLPPAPIASPSLASVVAALNPKKTDCLFYFHDSLGGFHCSETYEGHVALLKQYYGRGK